MSCITADKLFCLEDKFMKQGGLYAMWTMLFIANLICLSVDSATGPVRDFNVLTAILSTIYCGVSSANVIYGNKLPSSLLLMAGPVHQYSSWLLLAYYRGNVYGSSPLGVLNGVNTFVVGIFTIDMVIKTWASALYPNYYLDYANKQNEAKAVEQA
tara:strand:+ start:358 stop:825 length:468 start_codon:yes stop_codon:yes gene_type:complete